MIVQCSHCGKELKRFPWDLRTRPHPVCNQTCLNALRKARKLRCGGIRTPVYGEDRMCCRCFDTFPCTEKHFILKTDRRTGKQHWTADCRYCRAEACWTYRHPEALREEEAVG